MNRRAIRPIGCAVVSCALGLTAACTGASDGTAGSPSPSRSSSPSFPPGSTPPAGVLDLNSVLLRRVPGYELQESQPISLEGAAQLGRDERREKTELTKDGFVRGYTNILQTAENSIVATVYEFDDAEGARSFARFTIDDAVTFEEATRFTPSQLRGAVGIRYTETTDETLHVVAIYFALGPRLYAIAIGGPEDTITNDDVEALAIVQANLAR